MILLHIVYSCRNKPHAMIVTSTTHSHSTFNSPFATAKTPDPQIALP